MNTETLKKRIEILTKINVLLPKCNCLTAVEFNSCPNCKELTVYGQLLLNLGNKRKINNIKSNNKKPGPKSKITMTKAEYLDLKEAGKLDKEIAEMYKITVGTIKSWKNKNNIFARKKSEKRKEKISR